MLLNKITLVPSNWNKMKNHEVPEGQGRLTSDIFNVTEKIQNDKNEHDV